MNVKNRSGFTLIEVLIVVVIMAVLAATIIPQFSSSVEDSKQSQLTFNLHTLRSQIELYRVQHGGAYPVITGGSLPQLYSKTDAQGTISETGTFGPYLLEALPMNPLTNSSTVTAATSEATKAGGGWLYNAATGEIWGDGPVAAVED